MFVMENEEEQLGARILVNIDNTNFLFIFNILRKVPEISLFRSDDSLEM